MLTHIDAYAPDEDSDEDDQETETSETSSGVKEPGQGSGFDRSADLPGILSLW